MRKCATLKTDFLLWKQQFSSRSWEFCGVRGSGGSCRAWKLHDWAPEIRVDELPQTWFSEVAHSQNYLPALAHTVEGFTAIKTQSNTWSWNTSFPHHSKRKAGFAQAEADCDWCCTPAVAVVSPQWVGMPAAAGCREPSPVEDSTTSELHWGDCELCVSTFNIHQTPILFFVSPVSPSAILIASTFHIGLQLQAVMLQGCP